VRTLLERLFFNHRPAVLAVLAAITLALGYQATQLRIDAGFEKLLPKKHPYIQTFLEYQDEFGGANRLLIAVRARDGDIFTPEFFATLKSVTDAVFFLPGVNRSTVQSLFTPNVRFIEIVEGGFTGGNVVPADFSPTPEALAQVRENVLKSGTVGRLVANDFSAALVSAQLMETDPATGEKLDYLHVAELLETRIRDPHSNDRVDIHIIGFAKTLGDIAAGAAGVVVFFGIALLVTMGLVYLYTASFTLTVLPIFCSVIAVVWNLGLLATFGFGLDPMSLLVPFITCAIGISHGVQMMNAMGSEFRQGKACNLAARSAFHRLVIPGTAALLSDTVGFLTLLLIEIRIIQELAVTASLGVAAIMVTNLILLPILLSFGHMDDRYRSRLRRRRERREVWWIRLSALTQPKPAARVILGAVILLGAGLWLGRNQIVGDVHEGVPELRPDSRYNRDVAMVTDAFSIGLDVFTVIMETVPDGCIEHDVMASQDRFAYKLSNVPGVQSTLSLPQVAKVINAGWNEGHLKWRVLPRNPQSLSQSVYQVETSTGLLNVDCSVMPIYAFLEDHRAETLARVVDEVKAYAKDNDSDRHRFRLAAGNAGVMAATNEVVRAAQPRMLLYIYAAVILLCWIAFRSLRGLLCVVLPLSLVSVLAYGLMAILEIGLKTTTLPVAALGVGVGVDYGIYVFSQLQAFMDHGDSLSEAYRKTLRVTGAAVVITGLTLAAGVSTWILSALQFQADMGLLLAFMFLANMLGAVLLLPALAAYLYRTPARS